MRGYYWLYFFSSSCALLVVLCLGWGWGWVPFWSLRSNQKGIPCPLPCLCRPVLSGLPLAPCLLLCLGWGWGWVPFWSLRSNQKGIPCPLPCLCRSVLSGLPVVNKKTAPRCGAVHILICEHITIYDSRYCASHAMAGG